MIWSERVPRLLIGRDISFSRNPHMALRLKKQSLGLKYAAASIFVAGAGLILIKTFPHIKSSIVSYYMGDNSDKDFTEENAPIEIHNQLDREAVSAEQPIFVDDIEEWSHDKLKAYLVEVRRTHLNLSANEPY